MRVVCPSCHTTNRLVAERLREGPRCGRCHEPLFAGVPAELDGPAFLRHLERGDLPLVVDFWAPWCGPCRAMAPAYQQASARLEPEVRLVKINTDEEQSLGARFDIRSIPTLVMFRGGREVARRSGVLPATEIERWVRGQLAAV